MNETRLLDLRRVVCFVAVADTLSFRRAGERLAVDRKWVSAQVRGLEENLGVELLERHGAALVLTDAGLRLRAECDGLLAAQTAFLAAAAASRRWAAKRLAVGAAAATARSGIRAELLAELLDTSPELTIDVAEQATPVVVDRLRRGLVDIALVLSPFDRTALRVLRVRAAEHAIVMPREHPLAARDELTIDALEGFAVAAFDPERDPLMFEQLLAPLRDAGAELVVVPEPHPAAYAAAVFSGGLLAIDVDGTIIGGALDHERRGLVTRPISGLEGIADTYLAARRQRDHPAVDALWQLSRSHAASGATS